MTFRGPTDPDQFRVKHGRFGDRFYFDPLPADDTWPMMDPNEEPWPSVSTIKKVSNRDFSPVAARRVAEYATAHWESLAPIVKANPDGAIDLMIGADKRGLNQAGDRGTAVHSIMENLAKGIEPNMLNTPEDARPYIDACKAFLHDMQPEFEYEEIVCISRTRFYGGTFDCILKINGKRYMVDWKSRKAGKHAAYAEEGMQVAAYAKADYYVIDVDGVACRVPPPEFDGGLIVSLCPGPADYQVYPVDLDKGDIGFERMRSMWEVQHEPFFKAIGRPVLLMPRTYVPAEAEATVGAIVAAGAAAGEVPGNIAQAAAPEPWDPFGEDPFAGLPTGDAEGSTHPLEGTADAWATMLSPEAQARADEHDAYEHIDIGQWVEVRWMETMVVAGHHHQMEQVAAGWLKGIDSHGTVVVTDDNGNQIGVPGARTPQVTPAEHPDPPHVLPIANPVEDAVVEPPAVSAPPPSVMDSLTHVTPAKIRDTSDGNEEIRAWLRRRLESDVQQLGGQTALLKYWPTDLRTRPLDKAGKNQFTVAELEEIEAALTALETAMKLSFPEAKPKPVGAQPVEIDVPEDLATLTAESAYHNEPPPEEKDAHPDDIAMMIDRAVATSKEYPLTWKRIEAAVKGKMPNLRKPGVKPSHLLMLDDMIQGYVKALKERRVAVDTLCEGLDAMSQLAVLTYCGALPGEDSANEPTEDYIERISLLTDGLKSGKLEFYRADDDESVALGVSADTIAELRKEYPENVKLFRALNTYQTKYGFNSISRVGELRRTPLATLMLMQSKPNE